jgi:hypothetical protein
VRPHNEEVRRHTHGVIHNRFGGSARVSRQRYVKGPGAGGVNCPAQLA